MLTPHGLMKNVQISSPNQQVATEKDDKIAWRSSVAFMIMAWLFLGGFLVWAFRRGLGWWNNSEWAFASISLWAFVMIPVQVIRYFRERQKSAK